ncbi:Hypothetical protein D9617_14g077520 [Elsinoe fawcettii]|nr:Hypothetical protein D9617_14g077520 [Elsinoe fawcettii]
MDMVILGEDIGSANFITYLMNLLSTATKAECELNLPHLELAYQKSARDSWLQRFIIHRLADANGRAFQKAQDNPITQAPYLVSRVMNVLSSQRNTYRDGGVNKRQARAKPAGLRQRYRNVTKDFRKTPAVDKDAVEDKMDTSSDDESDEEASDGSEESEARSAQQAASTISVGLVDMSSVLRGC